MDDEHRETIRERLEDLKERQSKIEELRGHIIDAIQRGEGNETRIEELLDDLKNEGQDDES